MANSNHCNSNNCNTNFVLPTKHSDSDTFEISSSSTSQISKVSTSVPQVKSSVTKKEIFVDIKGAVKHQVCIKAKPNQRLLILFNKLED